MQIIRGLSNSKRWKKPEVWGILLLCIYTEVHGSEFLTLWESRCKIPHSTQPMDVVIKDVIHYIQGGNLANIYHQRNTKLGFNVCEWGQVTSTNKTMNGLEDSTSECKWTKYLPRKLSGKDVKKKIMSFYRGLSTYAVLLQHMETNEILWTNNLILDSEHSGLQKIHEIQNYFVTIGCIIESINGKKPTVDVGKLFRSIKLSTDFAYGCSEGNYALMRMEKFLEISQKQLQNNKKKRGLNKKDKSAKKQRNKGKAKVKGRKLSEL